MHTMLRCVVSIAMLLSVFGLSSFAAEPAQITIRSGNHPTFGRIVFDAGSTVSYHVARSGDQLTVEFLETVTLNGAPKLPRNVLALRAERARAVIDIVAGSTMHDMRVGDHVVIDVFDPGSSNGDGAAGSPSPVAPRAATPKPPTTAAQPVRSTVASAEPTKPPDSPPTVPRAAEPAPERRLPTAPVPPPDATPVSDVPTQAEASALMARPTFSPDGKVAGFSLAFADTVGAAAFRRGGEIWVVFDEARAVDLSALRDQSILGVTRIDGLSGTTLLRLTPLPGTEVGLARVPDGWVIMTSSPPWRPQPITPMLAEGRLAVPAPDAASVLTISDAASGAKLLVGTLRKPSRATLTRRRNAQFSMLPTLQGVVLEALADSVALQATATGFVVTTEPDSIALSPTEADTLTDATALTRRFAFPSLTTEQMTQRLAADTAAAAASPVLARGAKRRAVATDMIVLGMGAEAEAVLQLAVAEDPREATSPDTLGLTAIAAMLADRPAEAGGINDPRLSGTDEIVVWRAIRLALLDTASPQAAAVLATSAPLLLAYPQGMRELLLPLALETMASGGAANAASAILAQCGNLPGLDLVRATLKQAAGDIDGALALYDAMAAGHDQRQRARAAVSAVELRLASGKIDKRQAAETLDQLLFAWRGDRHERVLRERLAELRQQLGEWRAALTLLRDTEALFPDEAPEIHARLQSSFAALLRDDASSKLPPLDFVAMVDENVDLMPSSPEGVSLQTTLADRLLTLDLPKRAGPVLEKLMAALPAGARRATLGARLAALRLHEGDTAGSLAALLASEATDLPSELSEQRVLVRADALAQGGDTAGAVASLTAIGSVAADEARARILEQAKDWVGASRALAEYAARTVPESGELDDRARRTLLRQATAAARAGDDAALGMLRDRMEPRIGTGPLADMFRLLTASPVHGSADLARAEREVGLARALPNALGTLQAETRTP